MTSSHELEPLLDHATWVRRLAGHLVRDSHEADDVVQDTWLSALLGRGRGPEAPRRFLATVLRRRAAQQRRSAGRRRVHEARVEPRDASPSTADVVERAERGRELARLALELEEPYRAAVLLRHFEDLAPAAIAEHLGVPVKTVESRLARGHARLRERWQCLHPTRPGEDAWLPALILVAGGRSTASLATATSPAASAALTLGTLLVNTKLLLLALAAGGGLLWLATTLASDGNGAPPAEPTSPVAVAELREARAPERAGVDGAARIEEPQREALVARAAPLPSDPAPAEVAARRLRGRVVDPEGYAMPGVTVAFRAGEGVRAEVESGANGAFELAAPAVNGEIAVLDPDLVSLFRFQPRPEAEIHMLLVVARHRALAGSVHDVAGRPLPGARVELALPAEFRTRFEAVFDAADRQVWGAPCGADGRFAIERAPLVAGASIEARLDGYMTAAVPDPLREELDLELVLERPPEDAATIAGRVVDPGRRPVPGALVSLGKRSATTDAEGSFVLERAEAADAFELVAVRAGSLPGRYRALPGSNGEPLWPAWVELELGGAPLELAGRVVDQEGAPRPDVKVWLADPTHFGRIGDDLEAQLENLAAPEGSTYEPGDAYYRCTRTDAEGRFRLQGLLAREYRLGLLDVNTLERRESEPLAAGREDVRIELRRTPLADLALRLVSHAGRPVAGAHVVLHAPTFGGVHHPRDAQVSDADGRLRFEGVGGNELTLWIRGETVVPTVLALAAPRTDEVELTVEVLCHVKVDLSGRDARDRADALRILDAEGSTLDLHEIGSGGVLRSSRWELVDGRSVTLGVSDRAATLVLLRGDEELERLPLALEPGRLECVRP